ncbi:flgN protein [bacterium BMS3Bbin06]|nr:flgN protein [bacterium BMS3Abin08]GBE35142.1 flgN protein [bacterium BMS3Bbin06]HDO36460.1 flagellar protein FlgN [Nitrospirota bacterium]HDY70035.1 flagellar protein FlgN [Nitrospirota bacterium]
MKETGAINAIVAILEEQVRGYLALYDLLKKEKTAILSFQPSVIEEMAKQKDTIVLKLRLLEDERERLLGLTRDWKRMSIHELYELTGDERLPGVRSQLLSILQGIEELNEVNRIMIERASRHVSASSRFFNTYGLNTEKRPAVSREI